MLQRESSALLIAILLASICSMIVACNDGAAPLHGSCRDCNVVLISIDTLRADHLGCYGYSRPTSPFLDSLAEQSLLFEKAFVPRGLTRPSVVSMLTSLYPAGSGVRNLTQLLSEEIPTIDSVLSAEGYQAASFLSGAIKGAADLHFPQRFDGEDEKNVRRAIGWLKKNRSKKLFMWLHLLAPHDDYAPPREYDLFTKADYSGDYDGTRKRLFQVAMRRIRLSEEDRQHILALYDGEILYADALVRRVFEALKRLELLERSIVIVVGDHGEDLYQHQYYFQHMYSIYDSSLHIPLIMKFPGAPVAGRIEQIVQSIDIAPTILDLVGLPAPAGFSGRSLLPLIEGTSQGEFGYALSELETKEGFGKIVSIRTDRWRYVDNPGDEIPIGLPHHHFYQIAREELYDLQVDPSETTNVVDSYPEVAAHLRERVRAAHGAQALGEAAGEVDDDTVDQLRALGYVP
jgi:arylsulfatase A-like enzyme